LKTHETGRAHAWGDPPEVDHQRGSLEHLIEVEPRMRGHDHGDVAVVENLIEGHRRQPVLAQLGHVVVVIGNLAALLPEDLHDLERG
jgi:hypothetical protein